MILSSQNFASDLYAWSDDFYLFMTPKLWRYPLRPQQESRAQRRLPSDGDTEGRKRTQADNQPWRKGRGSWDQPAGGAVTATEQRCEDDPRFSPLRGVLADACHRAPSGLKGKERCEVIISYFTCLLGQPL
ncbi:uncharacterized protein LOC144288107 isoform X2 [Canis aureus]